MPMSKEEAVDYLRDKWCSGTLKTGGIKEIINAIWPIPDTPEPAPEYGDWIIWNAKPDSVCPPELFLKRIRYTWVENGCQFVDIDGPAKMLAWDDPRLIRYRIRQTPARGEPIVLYGLQVENGNWVFRSVKMASHAICITLEADASGAPKDGGIQRVEVI